ncbi:ABC transporter permease subunit [Actinomadura bangladeshensis]|uniref:ABC transporter permease subunit n=1 Tax=Actinomadura bangladeshensis TaxID=453573 RepID=A0A6L9QVJ5_9ACTN|nr:ABC transporter permease subunit [Actinomadura bangladeshensis]NEA29515.1 ABC transporter permease subunit [Actinomadura bangladeshensis]
MIWLAFRQFRGQAAALFGGLAVLGAALAASGPGLADDYGRGIASCGSQDACERFARTFFTDHQVEYGALIAIVTALPALIGIFWGAPLIARELEGGTHRLVWNQSITRTRWLAVKLGLVGLAAMAAAAIAVRAADWWAGPLDDAVTDRFPRIAPVAFGVHGIVPIAYAAFAFALGVAAGVLTRRTLPAMAITLAVFVGVQVAMPLWIRAHLVPPETATVAITSKNMSQLTLDQGTRAITVQTDAAPGAWTLANHTVDASGNEARLPGALITGACAPPRAVPEPAPGAGAPGPPDGPPEECFAEIARLGFKQKVVYQPADRFWPLQWAETGLFAVLTLGLCGVCFHWTRRRLS